MAQKRVSIFRKSAAPRVAPASVPAPQYPPNPLDVEDGNPRLVIVKYLEPSPLFPDDPSKGTWRVAWTLFGNTDTTAAIGLVADAMPNMYSQGIGEVLESLRAAGERVRAAEERAEALALELSTRAAESIPVLD